MIDLWYGDTLKIGHLGSPQRWVNVLGRAGSEAVQLSASLNGGPDQLVSMGPDGHRLANPGDFNVEIDRANLGVGVNELRLTAIDSGGRFETQTVRLEVTGDRTWPLPYSIDWSQVSAIHDVAEVVDGLWELTEDGVRVVEPYYDRVIGLGDLTWTDYEIETTVTFHGMRVPDEEKGDAGAMVIHAALATRWPGHDDDSLQPRVKWYPLGATAEFRVNPGWEGCSWRILGGDGIVVNEERERVIRTGVKYGMKHRVETRDDGGADYRVKLWEADGTCCCRRDRMMWPQEEHYCWPITQS
jgi:hypothetical protein